MKNENSLTTSPNKPIEKQFVNNTKEIYELLRNQFDESEINERESFKAMLLTEDLEVIKVSDYTDYTKENDDHCCHINTRLIFKDILINDAKVIVICHNHPNMILSPSSTDNALTEKINAVCEFLNVLMLDHMIISSNGCYSYYKHGK